MAWQVRSRTVILWEAVCKRCGLVASWAYNKQEAIDVAEEEGWVDGLCFECWAREQERLAEQWGIP